MKRSPRARRAASASARRFGVRCDGNRLENIRAQPRRSPARTSGYRWLAVALLRHDVNPFDHITFENSIHDIDAVEHLREDGVVVIETGVVDEIDEDLRIA